MDIKVTLTAGETELFRVMVGESRCRIQEDDLGAEKLRYGIIIKRPNEPVVGTVIDNEAVFGLMALGLLEMEFPANLPAIFQCSIWKLSELAKKMVEI